MRLFKYLSTRSPKEMYDIFKVVQSLKYLAMKKYANNYEDALDMSYFHIVKNYDSSKGDLKNYAMKVVSTINLNSFKKESPDEKEQTDDSSSISNSKIAQDYINSNLEEVYEENFKSDNVDSCIKDMVSLFVKDFKFFVSSNAKYRKMDYKELFDNYSLDTILNAKNFLLDKYSSKIEKFISYSKVSSIRNFSEDRYLKSIDSSLEYKGNLNDIIMIKRKQGSHIKKVYRVSIENSINILLELFYRNTNYGKMFIEDIPIYTTLSGRVVDSIEALRYSLEKELVGSLLSRTALKVLNYDRGNEILLSSTKDTQSDVILSAFSKNISINFERLVVKEV